MNRSSRVGGTLGAIFAAAIAAGGLAASASAFQAGAAKADITPPPYTRASDAAFLPMCGTSAAQVAELWPGPREFAFEKPYVDVHGLGKYAPGDPYCDADHTTNALSELLASDGAPSRIVPGVFLDAGGHLSDSPFASGAFTGAVGVKILPAGKTTPRTYLIGSSARGWATFDGQRDPGTAGTSLSYSVRTGGVIPTKGGPLLIDVFAGAKAFGL